MGSQNLVELNQNSWADFGWATEGTEDNDIRQQRKTRLAWLGFEVRAEGQGRRERRVQYERAKD